MAVEKTRLNGMLAQRGSDAAEAAAPAVGKGSNSDGADVDQENEARASEGGKNAGEGTAAPVAGAAPAAPGAAPAAAGGAGVIKVGGKSPGREGAIAKVAVGEELTFSHSSEEGTWLVDGAEIGRGRDAMWTAPPTGTMRNLRFEPYLTSTNKKAAASKPVMVLAPSKVKFTKLGDIASAGPGHAGVGMRLKVSVEPADVSFGKVQWIERPGPAENVTGYFQTFGAGRLAHHPNPAGLPMGETNSDIIDNAFSSDKPKMKNPADPKDAAPRFWAGTFGWTIPNVYKLGGTEVVFASVQQQFTMAEDGTMTVTKGGASATYTPPKDPKDGPGAEVQKFASVNEAKVYLHPHGLHGIIQAALNYARQPKADEASKKFLGRALVDYDIKLKASISCRETVDWFGKDRVELTANGAAGAPKGHSIGKGETKEFAFAMNSLINLATLETPSINLAAPDKGIAATIGYPYDKQSGSFGKNYFYETFFSWG